MRHLLWLVLLILLAIRIYYYYQNQPHFSDGTVIRITSRVNSEPARFENSQYFKLKSFKVYLPKYPEISYQDELTIEGVVQNDNLKNPKIIDHKASEGILIKLREKIIHFFQSSLPYKHSGLVTGIVLGSKEGLDKEFWEDLKNTGTIHVVVASGMNVSIVAKFLISFLALVLPRRKAIPFALVGIWSYSVLSGFDAPIIRASIMGSLTFIAQELGRIYYAGRALVLSAGLMIIIKPEWLFDLGFILSFVATASILLADEQIRYLIRKVPLIIRNDLSTTLSAQVGVAPILYASFGQFNILSPLYNVAVLWTIPIITLIGMLSGILSLLYVPLARIVILLVYPFTGWFIFLTTGF